MLRPSFAMRLEHDSAQLMRHGLPILSALPGWLLPLAGESILPDIFVYGGVEHVYDIIRVIRWDSDEI